MDRQADNEGFDLVDVSGLSLADLMEVEPVVLARSLHRILEEIDRPGEAVAGWQSVV